MQRRSGSRGLFQDCFKHFIFVCVLTKCIVDVRWTSQVLQTFTSGQLENLTIQWMHRQLTCEARPRILKHRNCKNQENFLKDGKKARQVRAAAEAGAHGGGANVNDRADSICWFCHGDVTNLENNKCAGCRKVTHSIADFEY